MSLQVGTDFLSVAEPLLLTAAWCAFATKKGHRNFPAFGAYLACRLVVFAALSVLLHASRFFVVDEHVVYAAYYYVFWIGYLLGAGIAFLVVQEVFQHLMEALPGLGRYGLVAFRWVTLTSALIAVGMAAYSAGPKHELLIAITGGAMRCMSILELCLLAFIVLSMSTLRLSLHSRDFGVVLGLAMIAAADLFGSAFASGNPALASIANYASQIIVTVAAGIWMMYFLRPEPESIAAPAPISSALQRWNEIAHALGEPAPQIALAKSNDFFLQDVEQAIDRVFEKNSMDTMP